MAKRNGPTVDVNLGVVHIKGLHEAQHNGGKGLIDLEKVDITNAHPGFGEDFIGHRHWAGQVDGRVRADLGSGADARTGLQPVFLAKLF